MAIEDTVDSVDSIQIAHITTTGVLTGRDTAVSGWSATTSDPDLVGAPGGGMRLVFGGRRTYTVNTPYDEGYVYYASSDAAGVSWTLAPNITPAVASSTGYFSSGTGVTTLSDGTLVTAYPYNEAIAYQVGGGAPQSFTLPACCASYMSLAVDGSGAVYAAWYANGGSAGTRGIFVRQLHPTLGPVMRAPGSLASPNQEVAMVTRADGGIYVAYPRGEVNNKGFGLWRIGTEAVRTVAGTRRADNITMSNDPDGRLWLAFEDDDQNLRAVRSNPSATVFGAVLKLPTPINDTFSRVVIEGGTGPGEPTCSSTRLRGSGTGRYSRG